MPDVLMVGSALLAAVGGVARMQRARWLRVAGLAALLAAWLGLASSITPPGVRDRWPLLAAAVAAALALGWVGGRFLPGREAWLLGLGAAVLVVRVPVPTGDGTAMLLMPLYAMIGFGALAMLRQEVQHGRHRGWRTRAGDRGGATRLLDVGVAALPVAAAASSTWSIDRSASTEALAFFLVPFLLGYTLVRWLVESAPSLRPTAWGLLAAAGVAALAGIWQAVAREVWWNPKVVDANRFRAEFRTNSLFWDPNIYGRALVVALLAVVAWAIVSRMSRRRGAAAAAFAALLLTALWHTYSQSSWLALAAALLVLTVLTLPPRARRWAAAAVVIVVLAGLPWAAERLAGDDASGRQDVVRTGLALAADRPLLGSGVGTFEAAARERARERGVTAPRLDDSHTTPVTVLAELGVLGMAAYLALLTATAVTALARWRRASTPAAAARAGGAVDDPPGWPRAPLVWATGALSALFVHSLLYAGFFEDPTLWVALAVLASLPRRREA